MLINLAEVKPSVVQNRCYARSKWDKETRTICSQNNIIYQGFSLLTANVYLLKDNYILKLSENKKKTPEQIIFRFCLQVGMAPLTGTTSEKHMKEDLNIFDFELSEEEVNFIENIAERYTFK